MDWSGDHLKRRINESILPKFLELLEFERLSNLGSLFPGFHYKIFTVLRNFLLLISADSNPQGQSQEGTQDPITLAAQANQ